MDCRVKPGNNSGNPAAFPRARPLRYVVRAEIAEVACSRSPSPRYAQYLRFESEPLVKPTGFREIRRAVLLGSEINLMGVQALGIGLGTLIRERGVKPRS